MEFRLLGSVEVWAGTRRLDAGPRQRRLILANLLLDAGRLVTFDTLIERVWEHGAPEGARQSIYAHVARIRLLLAEPSGEELPATLIRQAGGYRLDLDPACVDLHRFRQLVRSAKAAPTAAERVQMLRQAVRLWRGEPLADLRGLWPDRVRQALGQQRINAVVDWTDAELAAGEPAPTIADLDGLVAEFPLVEPLTAALMRALRADGRVAEALSHYANIRAALAEELGVDPGPELRELHRELLRDEEKQCPAPPRVTGAEAALRIEVPAQLPMDVAGFAGRTAELDQLTAASTVEATTPRISALVGTAAVGKTALAVRWAHQVAPRFPDGQLFVNLRGFDAGERAMSPAEAIRGFLDALGVPPHRIPLTFEAQTALFRRLLDGRRMLVLLDNARDVEQVRPLLPASPGCQVVVTSRRRMTSLVVGEGATLIPLDVLPAWEARELLENRLGTRRAATESGATDEIVQLCARLPLALVLVAVRAMVHPSWPLATMASELRQSRLDALADGDEGADLRSVFSWSYQRLTEGAARMFRLLAWHPGPAVTAPAAASLAGIAVPAARHALNELAQTHLLAEAAGGRFSFHDLLRAYAVELAESADPEAERQAARLRMYDHYLRTAYAADNLLYPLRDQIALPHPQAGVTPEVLKTDHTARAWFSAEHPVLTALVTTAGRHGLDEYAAHLAWTMVTYLDRQGRAQDLLDLQQTALAAVTQLGDRRRQGQVRRDLGFAHARLGHYAEASQHYRHAIEAFEGCDDRPSLARTHRDIGFIAWRQGDRATSTAHLERAIALSDTAGHRAGRAYAANAAGMLHSLRGEHADALRMLSSAIPMYQQLGDRVGEAVAWEALGHTHHDLHEYAAADEAYRRALSLRRSILDRYLEAYTLEYIGANKLAAGDAPAAHGAFRSALGILEEVAHPDAARVRGRFDRLTRGTKTVRQD